MDKQRVIVTDIQMPFGSMVIFMIKWAIATIPAALILSFVLALVAGAVATFFGGIGALLSALNG